MSKTQNPHCYGASLLYYEGKFQKDWALEVSGGTILKVAPASNFDQKTFTDLGSVALIPGTINTHNHSFQSLVRGFADDMSFFDWRDKGIYRLSLNLKKEDVYTGALFAFGEMLKHGITTVCDFFYLQDGGNENAKAVIQAAKDLGIRLVLARAFYDWEKGPKSYRETKGEAKKRCSELIKEFQNDPMVTIYPAPHSPHAASEEMIVAGFEIAEEFNLMFHIHLAEAQYEVEDIKKQKGLSPLFYLNRLGVVTNKMVGVHCVWLSDKEIELMGEREVKLSYNPSSNMFLGDGVAPIQKMLQKRVTIGLGTDGACSNNKTSIFEEMRMASLLQKVHLLDGRAVGAKEAFKMGTENGGKVLGLPIGKLQAGYQADFMTVNLNALELYPIQNLENNLVYSFSSSIIEDVFVHGKKVFSEGKILAYPEEKILERVKKLTTSWK